MAITLSNRFKLKIFGASGDPWLGRVGYNAEMAKIENSGAMFLTGAASAMPAPSALVLGTFYEQTDAGAVFFCDGTVWRFVSGLAVGTAAAMPAASTYGRMYYQTDTGLWMLDTGPVNPNLPTTKGGGWVYFCGCGKIEAIQAPTGGNIPNAAWTIFGNMVTGINGGGQRLDNGTPGLNSAAGMIARIVTAGRYRCEINVSWAANATGMRLVDILASQTVGPSASPSSTNFLNNWTPNTGGGGQSYSIRRTFQAGDYLYLTGYQSSGGVLAVNNVQAAIEQLV